MENIFLKNEFYNTLSGIRSVGEPRLRCLGGGCTYMAIGAILSHTMYELNSFGKSTPSQNRQLILYIVNDEG